MIVLTISLFASRAALSITTAAFVLASFLQENFFKKIKLFLHNPFLISISLLFFIPFASGLWSSNTNEWLKILQIKLPLLFFPMAFAGAFLIGTKRWCSIAVVFIACVFIATLYSVIMYAVNMRELHAAYLQAKVLPTLMSGDHIRFSLTVSIAVLLCLYLIEKSTQRLHIVLLISLAVWFAAYLHLLSARTGLFCLYLILIGYFIRLIFYKRRTAAGFAVLIMVLLLPFLSWWLFPTLQNRIRYLRYDLSVAATNVYLPGATDGNRVLSLQSGWSILQDHPFGVGAGDVRAAADTWYAQHVPNMLPTDKLYPSSEWLVHGAFAGWAGVLLFTFIILYPLFLKVKKRFYWCVLNLIIAASILFDTGLSTQYGVFIHAFFILAWWKCTTEIMRK